jgi:hypothetical protein
MEPLCDIGFGLVSCLKRGNPESVSESGRRLTDPLLCIPHQPLQEFILGRPVRHPLSTSGQTHLRIIWSHYVT